MSTFTDTIPMQPQPWCKNPQGYVRHQIKLKQLAEWLETVGAELKLPEDTGTWDRGVDIIVNNLFIDLKSFELVESVKSYTWNSPFYLKRQAPRFLDTLTDFFVHPTDGHPSEWIAIPYDSLRTSFYGYQPFCYKKDAVCVSDIL